MSNLVLSYINQGSVQSKVSFYWVFPRIPCLALFHLTPSFLSPNNQLSPGVPALDLYQVYIRSILGLYQVYIRSILRLYQVYIRSIRVHQVGILGYISSIRIFQVYQIYIRSIRLHQVYQVHKCIFYHQFRYNISNLGIRVFVSLNIHNQLQSLLQIYK